MSILNELIHTVVQNALLEYHTRKYFILKYEYKTNAEERNED